MVMDMPQHKLKYVIEFKNPVDYFDVILQKQIDLKLKFESDVNSITVTDLGIDDKKLKNNTFFSKYEQTFRNPSLRKSFLELNNDPHKYSFAKKIYNYSNKCLKYGYQSWHDCELFLSLSKEKNISYEEFEYNFDVMLEEFKLFCDFLELDEDEKKILDSIVKDDNLKSNIKFFGWKDYWTL
jgi:hypothetical protein